MRTFWVEELIISPHIRTKIRTQHGVTAAEIEAAVRQRVGLTAREEDHPKHGVRWVLGVTIRSKTFCVVLHHIDEPDVYALATAFPVKRGTR